MSLSDKNLGSAVRSALSQTVDERMFLLILSSFLNIYKPEFETFSNNKLRNELKNHILNEVLKGDSQ